MERTWGGVSNSAEGLPEVLDAGDHDVCFGEGRVDLVEVGFDRGFVGW